MCCCLLVDLYMLYNTVGQRIFSIMELMYHLSNATMQQEPASNACKSFVIISAHMNEECTSNTAKVPREIRATSGFHLTVGERIQIMRVNVRLTISRKNTVRRFIFFILCFWAFFFQRIAPLLICMMVVDDGCSLWIPIVLMNISQE